MELFENGGLKDEGGMVDKESGNKVPVGGTRKGVRDDIPAMVSEGEFVFPEDVVRYIGLDKLMQLRQKAKVGLKRMEDMGQMGNSDEATLPDDMPMDAPDLVILAGEAPKDMAEGGVVQTAAPRRLTPEVQRPERKQINFKQLMGRGFVEFKQYRNAQGATLLIPFVGGNPIYPIPSGYTLYDASTDTTDPTSPESQAETVAEEVSTAINKATGNDKDDDGPAPIPQSAFQKAGSWDMDTSGKDGKNLQMWIDEASKFTNGTSTLVTGVASMFGLGLPVAAMTAREKKQILRQIDSKIAQARKTDMAGQVAALEAIKKDLTEKTTGLGSALDSLTSSVADLFGMSEQQAETATETMNKITAIEDTIANQAPPTYPDTPPPSVTPETTTSSDGGFGEPLVDKLIPTPEPTFPDTPPPSVVATPEPTFPDTPPPSVIATPTPEITFPDTPPPSVSLEPTPTPEPTYPDTPPPSVADPRLLEAAGVDVPPVLPEDPATVPVLSQPEPAPITTGVSQVTTPSPRFGYESGQDVQQSVAPYLQGTVGGQPEFYSPPQIVTTQAQVEAPSAPQMTEPETFTATLPKPDPSMDPTGVGKITPLGPEKPYLPITTTPRNVKQQTTIKDAEAAMDARYANLPPSAGYAGDVLAAEDSYLLNRGAIDRSEMPLDVLLPPTPDPRGREQLPSVEQKLSSLRPTESSAPDTSLRPKAKPTTTTTKTPDTDKNTNVASSGRTETQIQADINAALDASDGEWTEELNDLVSERDSARSKEGTKKQSSSSSSSSSSESGCVIATHGISTGGFSLIEKTKAEIWCKRTYHDKWYGEAFRRGYRYAGNKAVIKGKAKEHYQEFKDFVAYGRGLKKDWKSAINYYKRTIQFFLTGLFIKEDV